jgi:hypothetical protein
VSKSLIGTRPWITLAFSRSCQTFASPPEKIVLVQDNLSTHTPAALYEAFPADEARRLVERFEWHYTPKHGSWLNSAESELGVLSSECLNRRMSDKRFLKSEVAAWEANHTPRPIGNSLRRTLASSLSRSTPRFD